MTVTHMEILGPDGENYPSLMLARATRDALARYCEIMAPRGRRKWVEARFDLTPEEARSVCEAAASATTIDKVWKHPNGGWAVLVPVMGAVIGHGIDAYLQNERKHHVQRAARARALVRDLRPLAALGDPPAHHLGERNAERGRAEARRVGARQAARPDHD